MPTTEINTDSMMSEVLEAYPGAQRAMMRRYHIGGCSNCGFKPEETLGAVLKRHNVMNTDEVIEHVKTSHEQEQKLLISARELADLMKSDNPPKLIDVRTPEEQEIVMIDGGLPASQELVQEMMNSWPKDCSIVTYCHHGIRSLDGAAYFIGHGFTNVRSLTGGIDAWAEEVQPELARY